MTKNTFSDSLKSIKKLENRKVKLLEEVVLLFSSRSKVNFTKQFINVLELGVYNKKLDKVSFKIQQFNNDKELKSIISNHNKEGQIFIGPIDTDSSKLAKKFCNNEILFFSFSSDTSLAGECMFLINFFPKNELEELFSFLDKQSKVALLYPENEYGYMINFIIDDVVNKSDSIIVNRSSYKKDLSNVRDAIKELGKYELRKYELDRQKKILYSKKDNLSKKRLKKLEKFKTTSDYDFTHILIADYGLNLLKVAPLLPYYDIDPDIVQFLGTGVIDDENFFLEPSLQGTLFPGIERSKRFKLLNQYERIYDDNFLRVSTLPYDLVGLLDFIFSTNLQYDEMLGLLNNQTTKFDGIDGQFYFKDNMIQRNLDILKIENGEAVRINQIKN